MAVKGKEVAMELATLALAKAIVEGKADAARAALEAADPQAFWIDGRTRLRELAKSRGTPSVTKAMEALFRAKGIAAAAVHAAG
jgi:hypothetical protein